MNTELEVRTTNDTIEPWDKTRIVRNLLKETQITRTQAEQVASAVEQWVMEIKPRFLTTDFIRKLVEHELIEDGLCNIQKQNTTVGIPVFDINNLVINGSRDNANMVHNPETVHKHVADQMMKQYAILEVLPNHLSDAHLRGDIHIHDLEFFFDRPWNCLQHDLRLFIKDGLKVDGTGDHTSVAGPPKHLETLMNHTGEIMLAAQQNMSGGQSMSLWNVFAAPFAEGRSYEEIKQCMEMLIFNLNMAYAARGSQVPFTSLNLEFTVPEFLYDMPAWGPKGRYAGVYGDFLDETELIQRAFTETLFDGDYYGKPHLFPNTIYVLRREIFKEEYENDLWNVHKLSAKFGTPYYANMLVDYRGNTPHANYMGCRTCLSSNWTGDWEADTLRTGNLAYVTINLPRLALKTNDESKFFEELGNLLDLAKEVLILRMEHGKRCLEDYKLAPFLTQEIKDVKRPSYYALENATLSFGFVGLNEALLHLTGRGIEDDDARKLGLDILKFMNLYAAACNDGQDYNYRWTVLQSPAESTAHRFALLDIAEFKDRAIYSGDKFSAYYTNSNHVPVDSPANLVERIGIESPFHSLTKGGHIFHAFLGESFSNAAGLQSLSKKMAMNSDLGLWAYSSAFSFCMKCQNLVKGLVEKCPVCGEMENVEWYDRVTGYIQQVGRASCASGGWNAGKRAELANRKRF